MLISWDVIMLSDFFNLSLSAAVETIKSFYNFIHRISCRSVSEIVLGKELFYYQTYWQKYHSAFVIG
jgi:hypothetical protein